MVNFLQSTFTKVLTITLFFTFLGVYAQSTPKVGIAKLIGCGTGSNADKAEVVISVDGNISDYQYNFGSGWVGTNKAWLGVGTHSLQVRKGTKTYPLTITVPPKAVAPNFTSRVIYNCNGTGNVNLTNNQPNYQYSYTYGGVTHSSPYFSSIPVGTHNLTVNYIAPAPSNAKEIIFYDDFGKYEGGPKAVKSPYANPNVYFAPLNKTHVLNGTVYPGRTLATDYCYTVARMTDADYTNAQNHNVWLLPHDKDKDPDGRVMYYNSIVQPDKEVIYKRKATVAPNSHVDFSAFVFNTVKLSSGSSYERAIPSLRLEIYENEAKVAAKAPLYSSYILDVPRVKDGGYDDWYPIGVAANTGNHTELIFVIRMFNQWGYVPSNPNAVALIGNDVALDNILVTQSSQSCPIPQTVPITVAANPNNINATAEYNCTTHKGKITVTPTNTTDYTYTSYKLDSETEQNSNVFNNVSLGAHTVTVTYKDTAKKIIFKEDFGSGSPYLLPSSVVPPPFICKLGGLGYPADVLPEGHYQVANVNNLTPMRSWNWRSPQDHTSNGADSQGRYLAFNYGKNAASHFYLQDLKVEPNKDITVEYYVYNINNTGVTQFFPNIEVSFINKDNNTPVNINTSGNITGNTNNKDWRKIEYTFNPGNATRLQMKFKDTDNDESANDFAIDDILVYQLPDTCTKTIPVTVSNPTPAPTLANTFAFCQAENKKISDIKAITLTNSNWYLSATGGTALADNTLLQTKEYYVSQTISGCESSDRKKVTVTIIPTAVAPTVAAIQTYCSAENKKVSDLSTIAGIKWYTSATGGTALPSTTVLTSQKYYGAVTANGCESARREVTVTITPTAAAPAVTATQTYCSAENKKVSDLSNITGIKWYTSATGGTALPATTVLTSQKYYGAVTANGCERARQEVTVTITPTAAAPAVAATQTYCSAENKKVSDLSTIAGIKWYTSATGGTALAPTTVLTSQKYYGAVTANGCESARREVTVTIQTSMMITGQPHQANYYKGASAVAMSVVATGTGPFTYKWFVNTTNSNTGGTQVATTSTFTPPTSVVGIKYYYVEITGACGTVKSKATPVIVTNRVQSDSKTYTGHPSTNSTPTNAGNILTNTKINGVPPTPTEVAISIDTPATPQGSAPVPKINTTTGVVEIPQGTPPGTYTIRYKVCDKATPTTCVITTATVVVTSNAIQAVDDNVSVEKSTTDQYVKVGGNDFNVLSNDKLAGVTGVQLSQVDIQTTNTVTGLTIEPATGKVKVSSSVQAGVYTLKYKIKEKGGTTYSHEASVTVVVKNKLEVTPVVIPGSPTPSTNNTPKKVANILDGVTLNGHKPNTSEVTISESTPATPKHTGAAVPKVQSNGDVVIPKGTPDGTYTIKYKVCDKAPGAAQTCKEATITIHVGKNHIKANDDDYSASPIEKSNTSTFVKDSGGNEVNVLKNDELTGITTGSLTTNEVEITSVTPSNPNVTIDPTTGKVSVAANTPVGNYTITYKIKEKGTDNESAIATVKVAIKNKIEITQTNFSGNPSVNSTPKVVGNILNNTKVDGSKPNAGDVVITEKVSAQPKPGGTAAPRINPSTGDVEIPQGTAPGEYNITYEVCDKKTPQACKTQTTKVTVSGNTIQAIDDDYTSSPVEKGTTIVKNALGTEVNILSNDKLGSVVGLTTSQVDITSVTPSNPKVTIDLTTGKIIVAADTPKGDYTITYKIKEKGSSHESSVATVKVRVINKVEVPTPNNFAGTPSTGTTPNIIGDIITDGNVKINGSTPSINDVTITIDTPATPQGGAPVPRINSTTGKVEIPQGVPNGNYTITYTLCDKGAPQTCKQAVAKVKVGSNALVANDDNKSNNMAPIERSTTTTKVKKADGTVANILTNDKIGNKTGLTLTDVTITQTTTNPHISIDTSTGEVNVAANTPAGAYTVGYKLTDKLDSGNVSNEATVTIIVKNKLEVTSITIPNATPSTNNTPKVIGDILDNTKVNGNKPSPSQVVIRVTTPAQPSSPGAPVPSVDTSTGKIMIPKGVKPGNYTITYEVCDKATPADAQTCKTAIATITVAGNTIQAVDDDYSNKHIEYSGTTKEVTDGGVAVNILANDKLAGQTGLTASEVTITQVSTTYTGVTIEVATGKVKVAGSTPAGTYTIKYTITEKGGTTASNQATVTVVVRNKVEVSPNEFTGEPSNNATPRVIGNITDNVKINGSKPNPSDVTITIPTPAVPKAPGAPVPSINPSTGDVVIPQGTPAGDYPITVQVCDKATPATCTTQTITVKVKPSSSPFNLVDDTVTLPRAGGSIDVLSNDKLKDGTPIVPANVTVTIANNGGLTGVSVNTDGKVIIPSGTPSGNYEITYKVCNSDGCDTAKVKLTVKRNVIKAIDDDFGRISNATTNTTSQTVFTLGVDTLEGKTGPLSPATDVILTPGISPHSGITMGGDGNITVAQGTPRGAYVYSYTICERGVSGNCSTANAYLEVVDGRIIATDDGVWHVGVTGGLTPSVLDNDKLGSRIGLTASDVSIEKTTGKPAPDSHLEMNSDGRITVKPGIAIGTYIYYYTIINKADPTETAYAKATIEVSTYVAQDDVFDIDNPINQSVNTPSVLENDELNGKKNPSPITDVILTPGTSSSTNLVMNADGTITIAPNTPDGTYTYTYTVCQKASPTNCKTGTATIKLHPALVANDDDFSATPVKSIQPTVVGNVLNNAVGGTDTLSGNPITDPTLVQISLANNGGLTGVVINNNGDVTVPQGAISGTYHVTYRICLVSNPSVCKDARVTIVVLNDEPLTFYNGISSNGDGYNDGFIIKNIELYPKNNLKIFNRWGVLVYEKDGYTNTDPFKGYSTGRTTVGKDGKLPQGTYYYILEYLDVNKNTQQKSGWLYLKNE